jgi:hypothetical protein
MSIHWDPKKAKLLDESKAKKPKISILGVVHLIFISLENLSYLVLVKNLDQNKVLVW